MKDFTEDTAPVSPPTTTRPNLTTAQMVEKYILLRDKKAEIDKRHKAELAPFNLTMGQLEAFMTDDLNNTGGESLRTEHGTIFKSTRTSATVKDWPLTFEYIQKHDAWDMLEHRVSKTAVLAAIEETGQPVPGVSVSQETTLNIRRS